MTRSGIVPRIAQSWWAPGRVVASLRGTPYHLVVAPHFPNEPSVDPVRHILRNRMADGVIFSRTEPGDARVKLLLENDFPFAGRLRFVDPETGESLIAGRAETWREPYLDRLGRHRAGLRALAEGAGWTFRLHVTDRPAVEPLTGLAAALALRGGPAATQLSGRE